MPADLSIQPNVYYTLDEAAARLRVSPRTVRRLLEEHTLTGVKIGGKWRILGANLLRLGCEDWRVGWQLASLPALWEVWDNLEDAVYDEL